MQRQILMTIRADVRKAMGPQSRDIRRYYEAYKREFRGQVRHSSKEELLKHCLKSDVIFLGDYHTFEQSQKAALRLLRELVATDSAIVLGFELVPAQYQNALDEFMAGGLDEEDFLSRINYKNNWGFAWEHFKPLFDFARQHGLKILGLNFDSDRLATRDAHAAAVIANFTSENPKRRLFVLYGDLHLARGHIPKFLKIELRKLGVKRKILTIFQNSESLYWKLAESRLAHTPEVLALGGGRFCIMNAAPWVKLQSYLEWTEKSELISKFDESAGPNLHEIAHERLKHLAEALSFTMPENLDFTIQTVNDLSFVANSPALRELNRSELKVVKYHILGNRGIFIPGPNLIYLASASVNSLSEGVSLLVHSTLSGSPMIFYDAREHFYAAVLNYTLAYFGSKVLNHKRKCDMEEDLRLLLERRIPRGSLPQEKLQRKVAKLVLRHCRAQREYARDKTYRAQFPPPGPGRVPLFLETARCLGGIMGEKLYASFIEGRYPLLKLERLFRSQFNGGRETRASYLKLVGELERAPLGHTSKLDLF
ncbi:MAG: ChaN family lipoprotein [Deltaproteobacteria bacterium]|nr:ChaN family lipoprotein [Deltaproteobacteria bacterium]